MITKNYLRKKEIYYQKKVLENSYYGFGIVSNNEIDKINILNASLLAMKRAILNLPIKPALVLVDGIYKPDLNIPMKTIIGGDSIEDAISAASIIAKVYRDNLMIEYNKNILIIILKKIKDMELRSIFLQFNKRGFAQFTENLSRVFLNK